jgi:chitinase
MHKAPGFFVARHQGDPRMVQKKMIALPGFLVSRTVLVALLALAVLLTFESACFAVTVTLRWGASTGATGYRVYYRADSSTLPLSGTGAVQGSSPINVGNQTTATISGLDPAHSYYFAVTAYNSAGESPLSNRVYVPELQSPSTSITYPANNANVSGTVAITASASDNVGVSRVEFYVNGVLRGTDTSTPYTYSWNTASQAAGSYTLMTRAYDAAGNVGQSGNVVVTNVRDTTAPTVSITSPTANATVSGTVSIAATAADAVGVARVEFYQNGVLLSASNVAPYRYSWNTATVANGVCTLYARAYDAAGNVRQSASVLTAVNNTALLTTAAGSTTLKKGDVNLDGRVDIADALVALRIAVGSITPSRDNLAYGDVTPLGSTDGKITIQDVMAILSAASGRLVL